MLVQNKQDQKNAIVYAAGTLPCGQKSFPKAEANQFFSVNTEWFSERELHWILLSLIYSPAYLFLFSSERFT